MEIKAAEMHSPNLFHSLYLEDSQLRNTFLIECFISLWASAKGSYIWHKGYIVLHMEGFNKGNQLFLCN